MYEPDDQLFTEALQEIGQPLTDHPQFMLLTAAASTLLAAETDVDALNDENLMFMCGKLGFILAEHADVKLVRALLERVAEKKRAREVSIRTEPFQPFEALFYRDRHGQIQARFSMGTFTFPALPIEESWELKFVCAYHDALCAAFGALQAPTPEDPCREPPAPASTDASST